MYTSQQNNSTMNPFQQNQMGYSGNDFNRVDSFGNTGADFARDPSFNFNALQQQPSLNFNAIQQQPTFNQQPSASFYNQGNQPIQQTPNMMMNNINYGTPMTSMNNMGNMGINNMPQMALQHNVASFGNPSQPLNNQAQLSQQLLDVILRSFSASGIRNIRTDSGLTTALFENHLVVPLSQFLSFLENLLRLSREQAYQVAQSFLYKTTRNMGQNYLIDIEAFEKVIYSSNAPSGVQSQLINMNAWQTQRSAYDILKKVNDQVRQYLLFQNGDILKLFIEADVNKDNFITLNELGYVLEKLGFTQQNRLNPQEIQSLFSIFDKNGDGRISYSELCQQFADLSNVKAIKDPNFWAYYIFQNIRTVCQYQNKSLAQLFNLSGQFRGWDDRSMKIPRDQFLRCLAQNGIPLQLDHEQKLFDLLQTTDSIVSGDVDFLYLSELIGIETQNQEICQQVSNGRFTPSSGSIGENSRKFFRSINKVMLQQGLDIKNLERLLQNVEMSKSRGQMGLQGIIDLNEFVSTIKNFNGSIDVNLTREVGIRFSQQNNLVIYNEFINTLKFEQQKFQIFNAVFSALQASLTQFKARSLRDLFAAVQPQFQYSPQIDITTLDTVIKSGSRIPMKQSDLQMIVLEYATTANANQIDFQAFEKDFQDFMGQQVGQSMTNNYNTEFNNFLFNPKTSTNFKRPLPTNMNDSMRRIALTYEQDPSISISSVLGRYQVNPQTGSVANQNFQSLLFDLFKLRIDEIQNIVAHYDQSGRMEIRIQEFLEDLKDFIGNVGKRMEIINLTTKFGGSGGSQMNEATLLSTYGKDIEEMIKGVMISGKDTFQLFSMYSQQPGRLTLSKMDFSGALISLDLSRQLNEQDISAFFAALDLAGQNVIQVAAIDGLFKKYLQQRPKQVIEEDIIEKLIRTFNGDVNFLQRELAKIDPMGRGILDTPLFVQGIKSYLPQTVNFSNKDLILIAKRYENIQLSGKLELNQFLNELRFIMNRKGMTEGIYNMHLMGNTMGGLTPGGPAGITNQITQGNTNPMLGMGSRNTRAEQLNPHMDQQRSIFRTNIDDQYFQDLVKATYLKGETVYKYFSSKASPQDENLLVNVFSQAILSLGVNWNILSTNNFFNQIDLVMNRVALGKVTAQQIDEAVNLGCKMTINEMSDEILKIIREQVLSREIDFKLLVKQQDIGKNNTISLDAFLDIVLNKLKVPSLVKNDVMFLAKKYIRALPNSLSYLQLLDDFDMISKGNNICSYIRKACLVHHNITEVQQYFKQHCSLNNSLMSFIEFSKACNALYLVPEICQENNLKVLFDEIDTAKTQKVTMDQIVSYIRKMSPKQTRDLQEEVLDEIAQKLKTTAKGVIIGNIFKIEDPGDRAKITPMSFANITMTSFKGVKEVDVKLLAKRYEEQGQINYKKFIQEVQVKVQSGTAQTNVAKDQLGLQPGVHGLDPNSEIGIRLKQILVKINDFVVMKRIQLANLLSPHETSGGLLPFEVFFQQLNILNVTDLSNEDIRFLAENYLKVTTSVNMRGGGQVVDYLKFLGDLKLHGVATKSVTSLTNEQKKVFSLLGTSIKTNNAMNGLTSSLLDSDPTLRGYLPSATLAAIFRKNGVRDLTDQQFTTVFTAIDKNSQGDSSYKQLLELILGAEETQRLFAGAAMGVRPQVLNQAVQFAMPIRPTNPQSKIMGEIGMKLIAGGKNYEEEFRQRIGQQVAQSDQPSSSIQIVYQVLDACCSSQKLTNDERTTLEAYLATIKDPRGNISLLSLLQGLGLPPQTLGIRGTKAAPRKILSLEERQKAQKIIFELRKQLTYLKKTPQDVFEKCKAAPSDVSIPESRFRMAVQNSPEFGQVGLQVTDDLIRLLIYYLQQEVQGEVSYKKLYFAFVQTESEQPLQQEGIDEIKKYEQLIREQASKGTPIEILELVNFMRQQGLGMPQIFKLTQTGFIQRSEFENSLKEVGFKSRDIMKLIEVLDTKGNRQNVSLDRLNEYLQKQAQSGKRGSNGQPTLNMQQAREQYQGFDPKVRQILQKISESLKKNGLSINKLFDHLDANRDGVVDREEFVNSMPIFMQIPGVDMRDYAIIFNALDINNDGVLSLNEFGMFLEGAKLDQIQRIREIDPKLIEDMTIEVRQLFTSFDANKDGFITADEIKLAMLALGRNVSMEEAQNIIRSVDQNGDGRLDQREFCDLMLQKMKDELLSQEDNIEELRAHFVNADMDHSGTLSVNEIYGVLLKMGADLTLEELIQLMSEIDVDRNGALDIDEFVALMTVTGNEMEFSSDISKKTLQSIRKCRKLNPLDFLKQFKSMPVSFIPSFLGEKWKNGKNLPSSVFMPTIDPKTMLYKDMMPVVQENLPPNIQAKKVSHPKLRPQNIEIGCEITFEEATGVPLPQANEKFDRSQIVKRAVRLGLYDSLKKEYYANTAQVNVLYQGNEAEDIWKFLTMRDNSLNPVLFRAANGFCRNNCYLVFELVIYVKFGSETSKVTEMSCGWCSLELKDPNVFQRQTQLKLPIHGGSPQVSQEIDQKDVHTTRTGLKHSIQSMFNSKIESQLTVNIKPHARLDDDNRFHMSLIPQTCFIQKRLLYFVSGFRNYIAQKLLKQMAAGSMVTFKQPEGDALISTFQKVLDCPDIAELFVKIWSEDFLPNLDKMNIEHVIQKTRECLRKIYPLVYAEEFGLNLHQVTDSAIGDQYLMRKREELLNSALKHGNPASKATTQPLEQLTSFRPFSIRENDFDVWYSQAAKSDQILQQYGELGIIKPTTPQNYIPSTAAPGTAQGTNQMGMMSSTNGGFNPRNTGMSMVSNQSYQQQPAGLDLRSAYNAQQRR